MKAVNTAFFCSFELMSSLIEKYKIVSKLGKQINRKFGEVFLAEDRSTGEKVVMKVLIRTGSNTPAQERLKHEASFSFEYPGLPRTIDLLETENEIVVIKSYEPGIPLDEFWLTIPKKQRKEQLIRILNGLVPLFDHLKKDHVVHCDLKPGNILIDAFGEELTISLIDFGLALRTNEQNERSILFPLGFAAPELLLNRLELVDHRTDLYALGILIWRLYTGKLPLTHPNPSVFTNLQLTHPLPESSELPTGLYPLLLKLSAKHQFRTAPNLMHHEQVTEGLKEGMNERYAELRQFIADFNAIPEKKNWFGF